MSIKTHYAVAQAGETDNGKMSSITSIAPATKLYFPCDEGSGTTTSDNAASGIIFDNGDALTAVSWGGAANSCVLGHFTGANGEQAPYVGTVPSPAGNSFLVWHHALPTTLIGTYIFGLGVDDGSEASIKMAGGTSWRLYDDSLNTVIPNPSDGVVGEIFFTAIFVDRTNNLLYCYTSTDGAAVALDIAAIDISGLTDDITFSNAMQINAFSAIDTYGCGMYVFSDTPTAADVLTNLEAIRVAQLTANKALPTSWITEV